jgi:drug/metabolite transporter (DMT)-like permease
MSDYARGVVLVLIAGLLWSLGGVMVRSIESADVWQISVWRSGTMAATGFLVVLWRYRGAVARAFQSMGRAGLTAALFIGAANLTFITALTMTTVANTLFILAAQPFMVALLARFLLKEPVARSTWLAMSVAAAGVAVMVGGSLVAADAIGTLFAIGCAVFFSIFVVALRAGRATDQVAIVTVAGVLVTAAGLVMSGGDVLVSVNDIFFCVLMGSTQVTFGLILFIAGSRYLPGGQLTLMSQVEVVLGPFWVFLVYAETPTEATLAGGALVLAAILAQTVAGRATAGA